MNLGKSYHNPGAKGEISSELMKRNGSIKGDELWHICTNPDHDDRSPSAHWNEKKGVFNCFPCGDKGGVKQMAERLGIVSSRPLHNTATLQHSRAKRDGYGENTVADAKTSECNTATLTPTGITLEQYSFAKRIPASFLESIGITQARYANVPAIRLPYHNPDGTEGAVRYRLQLEKSKPDNRFRWRKGSKLMLYGLERIDTYRAGGEITIVEGESCTQTAWYHGIPAVGLPGAGNWKEERDAHHFEGFERINVIIEPDTGGETVRKWLETSSIRDRVYLVDLGAFEDVSGLWLACGPREAARDE